MKARKKMKTKKTINYIWYMTAALSLLLSGCGKKDAGVYGEEISNQTITKVESILTYPENFEGKTVTIQGKIINECPSGCWFDVKEDAGVLYVDLNPSGFAIPQKVNKEVIVEGKVSVRDNQPIMTGTGVEIK
jgi:hypothetical protein